MRDYAGLVNDLRCHAGTCEYKETECSRYNKRFDDTDYTTCSEELCDDAADAIEELLAKVPTAERLAEILSRYFQIGDSYTFELTRVKEAFAIGTMSFDDFSEWDDENVSDLAEYIMESLSEPPKGVE